MLEEHSSYIWLVKDSNATSGVCIARWVLTGKEEAQENMFQCLKCLC